MNHDHSKKIPDGASFDRSGSQDSLDELSMDDYWKELENIHETRGNNHEERVALVVKEPDGNEICSVNVHQFADLVIFLQVLFQEMTPT